MYKPKKCHPHYCEFDSPACPERCKSQCKRVKPNCVSVTAQEALNIPELTLPRTKTGIPVVGICTRERVFGIPYDPRKDFDIPLPKKDLDMYLKHSYDSLHDKALKEYITEKCCEATCNCPMGRCCICRLSLAEENREKEH